MCVCILTLVIRLANRIFYASYYIVICGLFGSTTFSRIIVKKERISEKVIEHKTCGLIFPRIFVRNVSHDKNSARYYHKCGAWGSVVVKALRY